MQEEEEELEEQEQEEQEKKEGRGEAGGGGGGVTTTFPRRRTRRSRNYLFTYLSLVPSWKHSKIRTQRTDIHHFPVLLRNNVLAKYDVLLQCSMLDPGLLGYIC